MVKLKFSLPCCSDSTYVKVLCALSIFIGLLIAFAGHRYFQLEMILAGFLAFSSVSYIMLVNHFDPDVTGTGIIFQIVKKSNYDCKHSGIKGLAAGTSVMGLLGGVLWWFVWWFWGIPALSVLPVVFVLGFLMASVLFYLPINFEFLTNDFNFWSAFCCCWLVLPVVFVTFTRLVSYRPIIAHGMFLRTLTWVITSCSIKNRGIS